LIKLHFYYSTEKAQERFNAHIATFREIEVLDFRPLVSLVQNIVYHQMLFREIG